MEIIRGIANRSDVSLVIVDSLRGAHQMDEDSSKMIMIVKLLAELARDVNKPVLVTHHPRKPSFTDSDEITLDQLRGSSAIVQLARMVWAVAWPDHTKENRRMSVIKSNLGKYPNPISFQITDTGVIFVEAPQPSQKEETQTKKAENIISELLKNGPVPHEKVKRLS